LNGNVLFCRFFFNLTQCIPKSGLWCCVFLTLRITLIYMSIKVPDMSLDSLDTRVNIIEH
jgi:hypothetical protein